MASNVEISGNLTNYQYVRLGQSISCSSIESIALGYMNIEEEKIRNLKTARRDDVEGFVRDVIKEWACRHPNNQVQDLARILFRAAQDGGYVDPSKIEEILEVSPASLNDTPLDLRTRIREPDVTLEELLDIAEAIRPYMERAMKIEVAPWIKDYVVNMEELYTGLVLEKIDNKPFGQQIRILSNYLELFRKNIDNNSLQEPTVAKRLRLHDPKDTIAHKIVIKGDPGMGKTTLCKKIAWDWARKLFQKFPMVFFVFLKLVKPQDVIEHIIIQHNPFIEGLNIREGKIRNILEAFGNRCLLILDGLDEHALGTNDDVFKIIRGKKYLTCNIIVTSRPHSTSEIEPHFPVIARVEGFTKNKAEQFARKIVRDDQKIAGVLNFNPVDFRNDVPIYKCPILLSFLCLLVNEDDIDLSDKTIDTGEIYTRMIRCLYRKFTIRRGIDFDNSKFLNDIFLIGKLALKTLLSGNPMLKRTDVIREVGPDAFDYGLLIGHEDFKLIRDETADIYVTFPHRSIQEFLGAFYFVCVLHKGHHIETVLDKGDENLIFMKNPFFLQSCLWLLCNSKKYFDFHRGQDVYKYLRDFCVEKVNGVELNTPHISKTYPALDVEAAHRRNDQLRLNFLRDIFVNCDKMSCIILEEYTPLDWILSSVKPILKQVTRILLEHSYSNIATSCRMSYLEGSHIVVIRLSEDVAHSGLQTIEKHYGTLVDNPSFFLYIERTVRDGLFDRSLTNVKALNVKCAGDAEEPIESSPYLTHLSLQAKRMKKRGTFRKGLGFLCDATQKGNLPCLSHLSVTDFPATSKLTFEKLFRCSWPQLRHLSLLNSELAEKDLEALCLACHDPEKTMPNLISLCVSFPNHITHETLSSHLFPAPWPHLQRFHVDYSLTNADARISLNEAITDGKLSNLTYLAIQERSSDQQLPVKLNCTDKLCNLKSLYLRECFVSDIPMVTLSRLSELGIYSCTGLSEVMSRLMSHQLQFLETLIIRDCGLNAEDLSSLAIANSEGRLSGIKHLDISDNEITLPEFMYLFDASCTWNQLLSLELQKTKLDTKSCSIKSKFGIIMTKFSGRFEEDCKFIDYLNGAVQQGKLTSLQHLGMNCYQNTNTVWPKLERLSLLYCEEDAMRDIENAVRSRCLPALHTLCIVAYGTGDHQCYDARLTSALSEMGVSCHEFCAPWDDPFYPGKCHCQKKLDES